MTVYYCAEATKTGGRVPKRAYMMVADCPDEFEGLYTQLIRRDKRVFAHYPREWVESEWTHNSRVKPYIVVREDVFRSMFDEDDDVYPLPREYFEMVCFILKREFWLRGPFAESNQAVGERFYEKKFGWLMTKLAESGQWIESPEEELGELGQVLKNLNRQIENLDRRHGIRLKLRNLDQKRAEKEDKFLNHGVVDPKEAQESLLRSLPTYIEDYLRLAREARESQLGSDGGFMKAQLERLGIDPWMGVD